MKSIFKTKKKLFLVVGLVLLGAAMVWAAMELAGQANSMAQDAGANSASLELISLKLIKKPARTADRPEPPACDWAKERQIKMALEANDGQYQGLAAKAKEEMRTSGGVSSATKQQLTGLAAKFQMLCEDYAAMWDACNCITRATLARQAGVTRVKSSAVVVGGTAAQFMDEMVTAQNQMMESRRLYAQQAVTDQELADADKMDIRRNILPEINKLVAKLEMYSQDADKLYWEIQRQPAQGGSSGGHGGGGSGGKRTISNYSPAQKALRAQGASMSKTGRAMLQNAQELRTDAEGLAGDVAPPRIKAGGLRICFIGATEE